MKRRRRQRWRPNRKRAAVIVATLLLLSWWFARDTEAAGTAWTRRELLDAIRFVETSHRPDPPDGDGGRAIGPYQIHRAYWQDAVAFDPRLDGRYQDCRRQRYAERVIAAYMRKWVADAWDDLDAEVIARTHNGGPTGASKASTLAYWQRVRQAR